MEIVQFQLGGFETDFPHENYPEYFPKGQLHFVEIDNNVRTAISKVNLGEMYEFEFTDQIRDLLKSKHQFVGEPYLVQPDRNINCPGCGEQMLFLAAVGDDCLDERGLTGNEYVQTIFKFCHKCSMFCAYQQVD